MARKNKRQQPRKPQRGRQFQGGSRPTGALPLTRPSAEAAPSPAPLPARPVRATAGRAAPAPISQTAAVPLDRVPYFQGDLRRIAITGAIMLVILIAGSLLIH